MKLHRLLLLLCLLGACRTASVSREYEAAYPVFEDECPVIWMDDRGRAMCPDPSAEFVFPDLTRVGGSDRLGCPADKVGTISASWTEDLGAPILEQLFLSVSGPEDSELARHAKERGGDAVRVPDRRSTKMVSQNSKEEQHTVSSTVVRFRNPDCRCVTAWASRLWPKTVDAGDVRIVSAESGEGEFQLVIGRILIHGNKPGGRVAIEDLARFLAAEMGGNMIIRDAGEAPEVTSDSLGLRGDVVRIPGAD
jgi:hypothetical protein